MTREAALNELLGLLFSAEELRVHLALEREGGELVRALPEVGVSPALLVSTAVEALRRRGFIDRDFFDNLQAARPKRVGEIRKVRAQWLNNPRLDRGELWGDGRYELESLCGQGGFGLVWKAVDTRTGAFVALKILLEQHSDDRRFRQRFFRGAAVLANLSHPAIVRVHSGVEQEGLRFFYVMDYIDGTSLDGLIGKRPIDELLDHVLQIGDALGHLHARDLLHRDIKPSNILVTAKQQAKLLDFDLVTGDAFAPMTTRALGTALYAPPEASASDKKTATYDVFSLARTVEYVIRGRDPRVAELKARDPVATLETSEAVKVVLRAALRAEPAQRTQSVEQFCADLRVALKRPIPTSHPAQSERLPATRGIEPASAVNIAGAERESELPNLQSEASQTARGESTLAVKAGQAITKALVEQEPQGAELQRGFSDPYETVGDLAHRPRIKAPPGPPIRTSAEAVPASGRPALIITRSPPPTITTPVVIVPAFGAPSQANAPGLMSSLGPWVQRLGRLGKFAGPAVALSAAGISSIFIWCAVPGETDPSPPTVNHLTTPPPDEQAKVVKVLSAEEPIRVLEVPPDSTLTPPVVEPPQCSHPALTALADIAPMCFVALSAAKTFTRGSPTTEPGRQTNEEQHRSRVGAFAIGTHEVTLGQWKAVMGTSPNDCLYGCGDDHPVANVSWNDACQFLIKLTERENEALRQRGGVEMTLCYKWDGMTCAWENPSCTGFRLPTESEWEYAARAGTKTAYAFGDDTGDLCRYGNGADQSARPEHPKWETNSKCGDGHPNLATVGTFRANEWGLHDMHGNVWEWAWDRYAGTTKNTSSVRGYVGPSSGIARALRGGSFCEDPRFQRSAYRGRFDPTTRFWSIGFRCVRG